MSLTNPQKFPFNLLNQVAYLVNYVSCQLGFLPLSDYPLIWNTVLT